jgi:prephenate dehydratase
VQALAQTDTYLRKLGVIKEAVDDTAGAAQMVARQQLKVRHTEHAQHLRRAGLLAEAKWQPASLIYLADAAVAAS